MKNGRNICQDDNGCTYRIWAYNNDKPAGYNFYTSYPVMFRQVIYLDGKAHWYDAYGSRNLGINGDDNDDAVVVWDSNGNSGDDFKLFDDSSSRTPTSQSPTTETSANELYFEYFRSMDSYNSGREYIVTLCDY
jgi:hypothetical protein